MQVLVAVCLGISHGANDVGKVIQPFASAWQAYSTDTVAAKAPVPVWSRALCSVGLAAGCLLYSHNCSSVLGKCNTTGFIVGARHQTIE